MLLGNAESFTVHAVLLVHVDSLLWLFRSDETLFSLHEVPSLKVPFSLVQVNFADGLSVVLPGNVQCGSPVTLMLVHVDCFLGLIRLNELLFRFFEPVLIFKMQSKFQVNLWQLVLSMAFRKLESLFKTFLISFKVNRSLNETILDQELRTFLSAHILCDLDRNLT